MEQTLKRVAAGRLAATEIPKRMRTLQKDARGYPVPYIVVIDRDGLPQFTISDSVKVGHCVGKHLCAICGKPFERVGGGYAMWFVGGSRCFCHEAGAFLDPPAHLECAEYALIVCPFLAAPRYSKRIDDKKLRPGALPEDYALVRTDHMKPDLPERFGLGLTHSYRIVQSVAEGLVMTVDDWRYIEWWRTGQRVNAPDKGDGQW